MAVHLIMKFTRCFLYFFETVAQWFNKAKNRDVSTGPLARPFARLLAPLTRSLAPPCLVCSRAPLHSFICLLAHFTHSQALGKVGILISLNQAVLNRSGGEAED